MRDKNRKAWLYSVDKELAKQLKKEDFSDILENIDIEVHLSMCMNPIEPQDKFYRYFINAIYRHYKDPEMFEEPELIRIASAEAIILDPFENEDEVLMDMCDADSGDLLAAYVALFDDDECLREPLEDYSPAPVCYLEEFIVTEQLEFLQAEILRWIIKYLSSFSSILVFLPMPSYRSYDEVNQISCLTRDFDDKKIKKFRKFFTSQGFFPLRDTDYMYHIYDYSMD